MKSSALPEFWDCLETLSPEVQKTARKNFDLWQGNPSLKSLRFKKIRGNLWSVRVGSGFRALATFEGDGYLWFWIGTHDEYKRIIRDH